ncbi:MAG TPA: hypothetical protein PLR74_11135, partial [Agriterribacter sp.]|nr:hypothetical protein [Agriterribacter sp.]
MGKKDVAKTVTAGINCCYKMYAERSIHPSTLYCNRINTCFRWLMKILLSAVIFLPAFKSHAQQYLPAQKKNFYSFSAREKVWLEPAGRLEELKEKRSANSRYFIHKDTAGLFYIQQSIGDIHYKKNGQWLPIDQRLSPVKKGLLYEAGDQAEPVGFDITSRSAYIQTLRAGKISFNHWTLYGRKNGALVLLANANWSNFNAGDDGIYIHNIFPAIDAEMSVSRSSIKTSFIIHRNIFNNIDSLVFLDIFSGNRQTGSAKPSDQLSARFSLSGQSVLQVSPVVSFVENEPALNFILPYRMNDDSLSFSISTATINSLLPRGKLVIDPEVSTSNTIAKTAITGSMYNADCNKNNSCDYLMTIPTPAQATITDVRFSFGYRSTPPCLSGDGTFGIHIGNCGVNWNAKDPNYSGVTADFDKSIIEFFPSSCFPLPSCTPQDLAVTLKFYRRCKGVAGCDGGCIGAEYPFILTLVGHTIELESISPTASICRGSNTSLTVTGKYGVPPYSYTWDNNAGNGTTVSVAPQNNTVYTATITDQCNNTATGNVNVDVKPLPVAVAGSNAPLCEGSTLRLTTQAVAGATYAWTGPGIYTSGMRNPILSNVTASMSGTYTSVVTLNGCPSVPAAVDVAIGSPVAPQVSIATASATICRSENINFTATPVNGGASPSYQWKINGVNTGSNSNAFSSSALSDNDVVTCVMTSNAACSTPASVTSNSIQVSVLPYASPAVSISASSTSICEGTEVSFTAHAVNAGSDPVYQWKINGVNAGSNDPVFTTRSLTDNAAVTCTLSGSLPCSVSPEVVSNTVIVIVQPIVTPSVTINAIGNDACPGSRVSFNATPLHEGNTPVYQWLINNATTGGNSPSFSSDQLQPGDKIKCRLTSNATCTSDPDAISNTITALIKPTVTRTIETSICEGELYENYNSSGTYTDVFTGSNGCDSIRILHLTVKPHSSSVTDAVICEGESFWGYTKSGVYTDILTAANSCDSARTLRLTVKAKSYSQTNAAIC